MDMKLVLEDGTEIQGGSFGFEQSVAGEVVFNTAMIGYPESLSDPSYKGQILVLTYPLIGNYGIPESRIEDKLLSHFESSGAQISGLIVSEYSSFYNHWNAKGSLGDWLKENKVPAMFGADTRMLTKIIRDQGAMLGKLIWKDTDINFYDPDKENLVAKVSSKEREIYGDGMYRILLIDCGVKNNIIRHMVKRGTQIVRVPWDYDFSEEEYDGILISNGPGNPKQCGETIKHLSRAMKQDKPIFGICLGNQLMALASGADTYKLKYGHRSANQPCIDLETGRCYIACKYCICQ